MLAFWFFNKKNRGKEDTPRPRKSVLRNTSEARSACTWLGAPRAFSPTDPREDAMKLLERFDDRRRHRPRLDHGMPVTATGPEAVPPLDVVAEWPQPVDELTETGRLEDSLMSFCSRVPRTWLRWRR